MHIRDDMYIDMTALILYNVFSLRLILATTEIKPWAKLLRNKQKEATGQGMLLAFEWV
jgi:hypothetical protein